MAVANILELALIYGSARPGRFCDTVAAWAEDRIVGHGGFRLGTVDPAIVEEAAMRVRLARADAFVIVTPEYNHGYPAPLKALIDGTSSEWAAKPVAFVSYGGISGGLRAVEQLRQVMAEMHAVTIRDCLALSHARKQFRDGVLHAPAPAEKAAELMLARLYWWAEALRHARLRHPYEGAAALRNDLP